MKNFLNEYFYVAKHDKIKENVFVFRMCFSVVSILVCMFAMAFAAYGFFSSEVSVQPNSIASSRYTLNVKGVIGTTFPAQVINETDSSDTVQIIHPTAPTDVLVRVPGSVCQYKLSAGEYTFILEKQEGSDLASTGYCKIVFDGKYQVENGDVHYTRQIGKIGPNDSQTCRYVRISVTKDTLVDFVPSLGTYSGEGFDETSKVIFPIGQKTFQSDTIEDEQQAEETISEEASDLSENGENAELS